MSVTICGKCHGKLENQSLSLNENPCVGHYFNLIEGSFVWMICSIHTIFASFFQSCSSTKLDKELSVSGEDRVICILKHTHTHTHYNQRIERGTEFLEKAR